MDKMRLGYKILSLIVSLLTVFAILQISAVGLAEWYPPGGEGGP